MLLMAIGVLGQALATVVLLVAVAHNLERGSATVLPGSLEGEIALDLQVILYFATHRSAQVLPSYRATF